MLHVPFKGLAPLTTELLAGRIDLVDRAAAGADREAGRIRQHPRARPWRARRARAASARCRRSRKAALRASRPTPGRRCLRRPRRRPRSSTGCIEAVAAAVTKETVGPALARQGIPVALKTPGGDVGHVAGRGGEMGRRHQARQCHGGMSAVRESELRKTARRCATWHVILLSASRDVEARPRCRRCSLGIDRHRALVGAEHYAVGAEHLDRLAHVRRPEAHRLDTQVL